MGAEVTSVPYFQPADANKYSLRLNAFLDGLRVDGFTVEGGPNQWSIVGPEEKLYVAPDDAQARMGSEGGTSAAVDQAERVNPNR